MCIINANIYMCTARYKITYIHVQSHRPKPKPSPSSVDGSHVNPVTPPARSNLKKKKLFRMISSYQRGGTAISQSISASGHRKDGGREESGEALKRDNRILSSSIRGARWTTAFNKIFLLFFFPRWRSNIKIRCSGTLPVSSEESDDI